MDYLSENCYLSTLKDNNEMDLFFKLSPISLAYPKNKA
jgi:hypothetical protein